MEPSARSPPVDRTYLQLVIERTLRQAQECNRLCDGAEHVCFGSSGDSKQNSFQAVGPLTGVRSVISSDLKLIWLEQAVICEVYTAENATKFNRDSKFWG